MQVFVMFYRLCNYIVNENEMGVSILTEKLAKNFVMYRAHDKSKISVMRNLCDIMLDKSIPTAVSVLIYLYLFVLHLIDKSE